MRGPLSVGLNEGSPITGTQSHGDVPRLVDHLFRHSAGQVVSTLTRIFGPHHLELAEDVVQDALIKALRHWTYHGIPDNPSAWIMQVSKNGALDLLRRDERLHGREAELARALDRQPAESMTSAEVLDSELRDDQLRMIFTCCHPAISRDAQVALTLKTVGGFGVPEIARAFLVPEATIAQRLIRAKRALRERRIPFGVPDAADLPARLDAVLDVLYGMFNEGYSAHGGHDLVRHDLCVEAIRLTALLASHPAGDVPRVHALLALMLFQGARLSARTDEHGELRLLDDQDRTLWDRTMIRAGFGEMVRSAEGDELTEYHLQAEIAGVHALSPGHDDTRWRHILSRYDVLMTLKPSPVVALNRAVALAMVEGPESGLEAIEEIRTMPGMESYHLLHATRAYLLRRSGDAAGATAAYRTAATLTSNATERRFLERQS